MFFVISGFVIPFSMAQSGYKLKDIHRFLLRRFIRIEIPYFISIMLMILIENIFSLKNGAGFSVQPLRILYHIIFTIPFSHYQWYNPIFWTLAIEFQFYVLIAFLYPLVTSRIKILQYGTLILFGASEFLLRDINFVFSFSLFFLQGILLFLIMTKRINLVAGWIFLVLCTLLNHFGHQNEEIAFSILAVASIAFLNIDNKWTNKLGAISYSLYLTHGLIGMNLIYLLSRYINNELLKFGLVALAIVVSIVFALFFSKFVEQPSARLSKKVKVDLRDQKFK